MKLQTICDIVEGRIINESQNSSDYTKAFASDLMSDVLRFPMENTVLITGLSTIQTIRTAEISNLSCLIIARDKKVSDEMIELATKSRISIISTQTTVYEISGLLYKNGLKPVY
ncbi:DRTGG domain-containing protein [Lascolabacillus massiliensis]|uniref:DRTGG domain-containing protein n=1 Tax=Lascolabacillus massiliensis TaxID=1627894 RepID=UPI0006B308F3|nr:DRTGG domain-containing protein [Lascolabacillus massiliensis]